MSRMIESAVMAQVFDTKEPHLASLQDGADS